MQNLNLTENLLEQIPNSIKNLKELQHLLIKTNKLKSLPRTIIELKKLKEFLVDFYSMTEMTGPHISNLESWMIELEENECVVVKI